VAPSSTIIGGEGVISFVLAMTFVTAGCAGAGNVCCDAACP
jgi:hypothetical protein